MCVADAIAEICPTGGPNLNLGEEDATQFLQATLGAHQSETYYSTPTLSSPEESIEAMATSKPHMLAVVAEDPELATIPNSDSNLDKQGLQSRIQDKIGMAGANNLWTEDTQPPRSKFTLEQIKDWDPAPTGEKDLQRNKQKDYWMALEVEDVEKQFTNNTFAEYPINPDKPKPKASPALFAYRMKEDHVKNEAGGRVRTCCMGTNQVKGVDYDRADVKTPMTATVMMVIATGTAACAETFQFDISNFFQNTECDRQLLLIPPQRFRRKTPEGWDIYWKANKWLQGAKEAGRASRDKLDAILTNNPNTNTITFRISSWDPSLYIHHSDTFGTVVFCLHGDDGVGWSTTAQGSEALKLLLESNYPISWNNEWGDILGFEVTRNKEKGVTKITAKKAI